MNKCIFLGRLCNDPEVRYTQGENAMAVARYRLAINRVHNKDNNGEQTADFINCVAFGKNAEFAEKYLTMGMKMLITARVQTGSYTNKDGVKVYTTDFIVEVQEFAESKHTQDDGQQLGNNEFVNVPDGVDDDGLPFT